MVCVRTESLKSFRDYPPVLAEANERLLLFASQARVYGLSFVLGDQNDVETPACGTSRCWEGNPES